MFACLSCITVFLLLASPAGAGWQSAAPTPYSSFATVRPNQSECSQPTSEQSALIREAETDKYTIRRILFVGNRHTPDGVLRRGLVALQEGESFARQNLIRSLKNVSKLKTLYPARLRDVVVEVDKTEKTIDVNICFREKH
jgi:outer membrane protein assembly factor BamA